MSMRASTTEGSARVDVSPSLSSRTAILRSKRRMILPELHKPLPIVSSKTRYFGIDELTSSKFMELHFVNHMLLELICSSV